MTTKNEMTKNELIGNITASVETLSLLEGDAIQIQSAKVALGDLMLSTYRLLLIDHDTVPLMAWEDICKANGWAHEVIDPVTFETTKVKGNKPPATVKTLNTHVRNYFSKYRHLDVESMTELRKAIKGNVDQVERHVKSIRKLPVATIIAIMSKVADLPGVQKAVEEMKAEVKLIKKAV
jgi:hypothetical protein